jgi:hypothetical protein
MPQTLGRIGLLQFRFSLLSPKILQSPFPGPLLSLIL